MYTSGLTYVHVNLCCQTLLVLGQKPCHTQLHLQVFGTTCSIRNVMYIVSIIPPTNHNPNILVCMHALMRRIVPTQIFLMNACLHTRMFGFVICWRDNFTIIQHTSSVLHLHQHLSPCYFVQSLSLENWSKPSILGHSGGRTKQRIPYQISRLLQESLIYLLHTTGFIFVSLKYEVGGSYG